MNSPAGSSLGPQKRLIVGVSDQKVSKDPSALVVTYSLGSCIGLVVHDPVVKVGGILHFQLPTAKGHNVRARENPFMFADTGIPLFLKKVWSLGADKRRLIVCMFGGATLLDDKQLFKIGVKNAHAAKRILWQEALRIRHEDVGGGVSRTISLAVGTGEVTMRKSGTSRIVVVGVNPNG